MYLWSQKQKMPTTPGILWSQKGSKFTKKVLETGVSLGQLQWLYYLQQSDFTLDSQGNRVIIDHAYHRGERKFGDWYCDGYMEKDGVKYFLEYQGKVSKFCKFHFFEGCYWHPGCCVSDSQIPDSQIKKARFEAKKSYLETIGKVVVMHECQWQQQLQKLSNVPTLMPNILRTDTEATLIDSILKGEMYGFLVCDIQCSDGLARDLSSGGFLFPPVIERQNLTEEHFSDYMKSRFINEQRKLEKNTVVQKFNGKQVFIMTDLAKFYMDLGLKISNVTKFVQYIGAKTLLPFADKVYEMRVSATHEKDEAKSMTAKLFGNSGKLYYFATEFNLIKVMESVPRMLLGIRK